MDDKYFVAEFGPGVVIPTFNVARHGLPSKYRVTGRVLMSLEDAVKIMNSDKNNMDTWVVRPKYKGGWRFAYKNNYASHASLP